MMKGCGVFQASKHYMSAPQHSPLYAMYSYYMEPPV